MYQRNATSPNTTAADGVRNIPSGSSAGKGLSEPRATVQVASVTGVLLVRPANTRRLTSGRPLYDSRRWRVSVPCQPKCQIAVCGAVAGAAATLVNKIRTLFGAASPGRPPQLAFAEVGNCRT